VGAAKVRPITALLLAAFRDQWPEKDRATADARLAPLGSLLNKVIESCESCGEGLVNRRLPHAARKYRGLQAHWPHTQLRTVRHQDALIASQSCATGYVGSALPCRSVVGPLSIPASLLAVLLTRGYICFSDSVAVARAFQVDQAASLMETFGHRRTQVTHLELRSIAPRGPQPWPSDAP
jgi:hypothetical protein